MSVVCIGGACVDRKYSCIAQAQPGTSNPAQVRRSFGGVARNVAENLARLGAKTSLLTVVGDDENGAALLQDARAAGIDTRLTIRDPAHTTCEYAAVIDAGGELLVGVSDMRAMDRITEAEIERHWAQIEKASWLFVDCNASARVLSFCIEKGRASRLRVSVDAVSAVKVRRLPERLDGVNLLFLNEGEAEAYLRTAPATARAVRARGAEAVVLTRGTEGVVVATGVETNIAAAPARCVDPTGAGDALVAATLYRLLQGDDLFEAVRKGAVGAALTVESNASVRADLSAWIGS